MKMQNIRQVLIFVRQFRARLLIEMILTALVFLVVGCSEQGIKPSGTIVIPSPTITVYPTHILPTAEPITLTPEPQAKAVTHCQEIFFVAVARSFC